MSSPSPIRAKSEFGIIEAIRWRGEGFVLGVQWHPEFHAPRDTHLLPREPLIEAFLKAATARKEEAYTA